MIEFGWGIGLARTSKEVENDIEDMKQKVEELILLKLFAHLLVVRFEQITSHNHFKGVTVVNIEEEEHYDYYTKEASYIGENLVDFLETSFYFQRKRRFVEEKCCIERSCVGRVYCISVFYAILPNDASSSNFFISDGEQTFISLDPVVINHQLTLLSVLCWKHDVVAIFQIVTQELFWICIDDRIDEVDSVKKVCLRCK